MQLPPHTMALIGAAMCFGIRMLAIRRSWHLPAPPKEGGS
jgi:uncharacterized membrane protein YeiH